MNESLFQKQPIAVMCFSEVTGGMEMTAVRLARMLSNIAEVSFFYKAGSITESFVSHTDEVMRCVPIAFRSRLFSPAMFFAVRKSIIRHKIRNVIFLGASELKTLYFSFLGLDINLIVWHGTTKNHPKRDPLHQLVYSNVAHHVTISGHLLQNIQQIFPLTKGVDFRIIIPSRSVPAHDYTQHSDHPKPIKILHMGRMVDGKGQLDAIQAVEKLAASGHACKLTIIGKNDGNPYAQLVTQTIESSPYRDAIQALGFVDDIFDYLRSADIFLFPSRGEGMPGSVVEALHFPLVCLAYDNTVFPEFAEMGFHFHTVENNKVGRLADRLHSICANFEDEKRQARRNPALARKLFSSEREIKEWLQVLV